MAKVGYRYSSDVLLGGPASSSTTCWSFAAGLACCSSARIRSRSIMDNVLAGVRAHKLVRARDSVAPQARLTGVGLWDAVEIGSAIHRFDSLVVSSS